MLRCTILRVAARMVGQVAFANNCAGCHGAGGQGATGYANLNDDDWIWGSKLADIRQTIEHGVRWDADKAARSSTMPAFGKDGVLTPAQVDALAEYVRTYAELPGTDAPTAEGEKLYSENCAACHGVEDKGNADMGAPNLFDAIWLYGSDKPSIGGRITNGGGAVMPAWKDKLDETTTKALTIYITSIRWAAAVAANEGWGSAPSLSLPRFAGEGTLTPHTRTFGEARNLLPLP